MIITTKKIRSDYGAYVPATCKYNLVTSSCSSKIGTSDTKASCASGSRVTLTSDDVVNVHCGYIAAVRGLKSIAQRMTMEHTYLPPANTILLPVAAPARAPRATLSCASDSEANVRRRRENSMIPKAER